MSKFKKGDKVLPANTMWGTDVLTVLEPDCTWSSCTGYVKTDQERGDGIYHKDNLKLVSRAKKITVGELLKG